MPRQQPWRTHHEILGFLGLLGIFGLFALRNLKLPALWPGAFADGAGVVVANDADPKRCSILTHQLRRFGPAASTGRFRHALPAMLPAVQILRVLSHIPALTCPTYASRGPR